MSIETWTGQIVTASFEDGESQVDCGLEGCECPEHEQSPPPAGTYITIRLDGEGHKVGLFDVMVTLQEGKP